jgi:hypothetical protein
MDDEPIIWGFYGYQTPAGGKDVQDWYDNLPESARDEIKDVLSYNQMQPRHLWKLPEFESLDSELSEFRFKDSVANKCYRIYGMFPGGKCLGRYSYIFLLGKDKTKNNDMSGKKESLKRLKRINNGEATFHAFKFNQ